MCCHWSHARRSHRLALRKVGLGPARVQGRSTRVWPTSALVEASGAGGARRFAPNPNAKSNARNTATPRSPSGGRSARYSGSTITGGRASDRRCMPDPRVGCGRARVSAAPRLRAASCEAEHPPSAYASSIPGTRFPARIRMAPTPGASCGSGARRARTGAVTGARVRRASPRRAARDRSRSPRGRAPAARRPRAGTRARRPWQPAARPVGCTGALR